MGDGEKSDAWGAYLRRIVSRKEWSVVKLATVAGIHRGTIFDWMKGGTGESVTTAYVVAVARAVGDDPMTAFRAAAGIEDNAPQDAELALVLNSDLADEKKDELIEIILGKREADHERRIEDTVQMIRIAGGKVA